MSDAYEPRYSEPRKSSSSSGLKIFAILGCGCLGLVIVCGGGCGAFMYYGLQQLKKTKPWTDAVAKANGNAEVTAELGSPVESGWMMQGAYNVQQTGGAETGNVDVTIPLGGPKGKGSVHVVGKSTTGQWDYTTMEVTTDSGKKIDLLKGTKPNEIKK